MDALFGGRQMGGGGVVWGWLMRERRSPPRSLAVDVPVVNIFGVAFIDVGGGGR